MKNKWLIGALSCVMAATLCLGIVACNKTPKTGMTDEEIAQAGITTLNGIYLDGDGKVKNYETPDDYQVLAKTRVAEEFLNVTWSVTSETENIQNYVSIGTEADASARYTIDITRATFDIEYTLTASITVGQATKTANYAHKIPKKSSEDAITATLDFSTDAARTSISTVQQIWESNGLKLTNDKAGSSTATNNAGDNAGHIRLYAGSKVTIEFPGIKIITFRSLTTYEYFPNLQTVLSNAGYTADQLVVDEEAGTVKLTLTTPVDFLEFTATKQLRITSIDVEGTEGGATAEQNVAAVKAWLTVSQTSFNSPTTIALATEKVGTTISWAMKEASEYAKVEDGNLVITKLPEEGEQKATLVATISSGTAKDTKEFELTFTHEIKLENDGTAEHPYTVADVYKLASTLESGKVYQENGQSVSMYVKGIVTAEGSWAPSYSNWQDVIIADTPSGTQTLKLYGLNPGAGLSETNGPKVGGTLVVVGALKNYNGTLELTFDGSIKLNITDYTAPVDNRTAQEKVDAALQALADTFTVTKAGETDLPASTEPDVTFAWSTTDQTYTITGNKINVSALPAADATVTATVTATCGTEAVTDNTKTVTITIRAKSDEPAPGSGDGTEAKPFTVSDITEIFKSLDSYAYYTADGTNPALVYITGIITVVGTTDDYGIKNFYIAATAGDTENDILIYSLNWSDTVKSGTKFTVGDTIVIQAYLQNYNGTYEITYWREGTSPSYKYHNGYIVGHTPVGGEVTPPTPSDADATISFADTTNRTSVSTEVQIWKQNNVTVTVSKGGSNQDINETYFNPLRIYQSNTVKIEYTSAMAKIVFHCGTYQNKDYPGALKTSLAGVAGITVTVDGLDVTVTFETAATSLEFTASAQIRLESIDVYADGGTVDPEPTPDENTATYDVSTKNYANSNKVTTVTEGDVTFTFSKGSGTSDPAYYNTGAAVRLYPNNTLTVSVGAGYYITKIVFTYGTGDSADNAITVNKGTFTTDTWEGSTQTVILTAGGTSGHRRITSVVVTYVATTHEHHYNVAHDAGTFMHTYTCDAEGCYDKSYSAACALENNKCSACNETYTEQQIKDALFALTKGQSLPGTTYQLTGKVLRIDSAYDSKYGNVTFTMKIDGKEVQAYRTSGEKAETVKPGDTVAVKGGLTNYNGTYQFSAGTILNLTEGELTAEEKVAEVKNWLTLPEAADNTITLPEVPDWANGVSLSAESNKTASLTVEGTTLKLIPGDADTDVTVTVTISCEGATSVTKEFTVKVPAKLPEGSGTATYDPSKKYTANTKVTTETVDDVTLVFSKGQGSNDPQYYTGGTAIRAYAKNTITISVPAGKLISKITITFGSGGDSNAITADGGTYADGVWTGSAQSVVFTIGGTNGNRRIAKIEVVYAPAAAAAAVSAPAEVAVLPGKQF